MSPKSEQRFDRVIVIESTTDSTQPGLDLIHQVLEPFKARDPDAEFTYEYRTPQTRRELFDLLHDIAIRTKATDGRPILHLEIHSNEAGSGLNLASGEDVAWRDLTEALLEINLAARGNLVVVLAVCFGERLSEVFSHAERAPAFGLVGPNDEISFGVFEAAFRHFYQELLASGDGDAAIRALNRAGRERDPRIKYLWRSAEGSFRDHLRYTMEQMVGSAAKRQAQIEAAVTRAAADPRLRGKSVSAIRKTAKAVVKSRSFGPKVFEKLRDRYLMLDLFSEQKGRYSLRYEDCVQPEDRP